MLVELSVMEQRYHAVMEVVSGAPVTEVARRYGVSRQAVHGWLGRSVIPKRYNKRREVLDARAGPAVPADRRRIGQVAD